LGGANFDEPIECNEGYPGEDSGGGGVGGGGRGVGSVGGGGGGGGGDSSNEDGYYANSPYRVQRFAANIRERKRMLR